MSVEDGVASAKVIQSLAGCQEEGGFAAAGLKHQVGRLPDGPASDMAAELRGVKKAPPAFRTSAVSWTKVTPTNLARGSVKSWDAKASGVVVPPAEAT